MKRIAYTFAIKTNDHNGLTKGHLLAVIHRITCFDMGFPGLPEHHRFRPYQRLYLLELALIPPEVLAWPALAKLVRLRLFFVFKAVDVLQVKNVEPYADEDVVNGG